MTQVTEVYQLDDKIDINVNVNQDVASGTVVLIGPYQTKYEFSGAVEDGKLSVNILNVPSGRYILLSQVYEQKDPSIVTFLAPQYIVIEEPKC